MTSYYSLILQVDPPEQEVDITQLSVIQSKRLEMELQIKVLSLETQLERQRQQLFELRKTQYAATGENFFAHFQSHKFLKLIINKCGFGQTILLGNFTKKNQPTS